MYKNTKISSIGDRDVQESKKIASTNSFKSQDDTTAITQTSKMPSMVDLSLASHLIHVDGHVIETSTISLKSNVSTVQTNSSTVDVRQ